MRKLCTLFAVIVLLAFAQGCNNSDAQGGFNNGSLFGDFGYSLTGIITSGVETAVEVGLFHADGMGNLSGDGMTVFKSNEILTATYENCEYEVNPDGSILVDPCTRIDDNGTFAIRLFMVLEESNRQIRVMVLPTGDPEMDVFGTVSMEGTAQKQ